MVNSGELILRRLDKIIELLVKQSEPEPFSIEMEEAAMNGGLTYTEYLNEAADLFTKRQEKLNEWRMK